MALHWNSNPYLKFIQQFGVEQLDVKFIVSGLLYENAIEEVLYAGSCVFLFASLKDCSACLHLCFNPTAGIPSVPISRGYLCLQLLSPG